MNISGEWHNGYNFNNRLTNPDASVYFPAIGYRTDEDNGVMVGNAASYYWAAIPSYTSGGCALLFYKDYVSTQDGMYRVAAFGVRPVAEN